MWAPTLERLNVVKQFHMLKFVSFTMSCELAHTFYRVAERRKDLVALHQLASLCPADRDGLSISWGRLAK